MSKFVLTAQLRLKAPTNTKQVMSELRQQLQGVNIPVKVQGAAQAKKQLEAVGKSAKRASSAAQAMGKSFGLAFKRFAAFTVASRAVSLFTNSLAGAVDEAISFQREMIKISQVTGKTVQSLKGLEQTITRLSVTMGVSSKELLSTTRILSQAGLQADDLKVALAALAKTTLAPTFSDIGKTAEGAIAILAQFKEGVGALERQMGSINAVAGQFAVESDNIIGAVRRTGGVFVEAGGTLEEFIGLFTSVRATTRESSESIATGLRTIFTRIQRPKTIEFLKQYGVELQNLDGSFVGPYEAIRRLNDALAGLGKGDITFIKVAEQLGGFRQIGKVIPLLKEFELAERARQAAIKGGESLEADKIKAQAALAVQITKVKEEFLALVRGVADTTSFQTMVKTALGLASALIKVADAIKPLLPLIGALVAFKLASGLGGFAAGFGGALKGAGKNQGGRIHAFARGGMVPGQGGGDTVPAMLQPGEFVMRKSSVKKMGADRLASMNQNRFAAGGIVKETELGVVSADPFDTITDKVAISRVGILAADRMDGKKKSAGAIEKAIQKRFDERSGALRTSKAITTAKESLSQAEMAKVTGNVLSDFPREYNATIEGINPDIEEPFKNAIDLGIETTLQNGVDAIAKKINATKVPDITKLAGAAFYEKFDQGAKGLFFENVINAFAGQPLVGSDLQAPFDFTNGLGSKLGNTYTSVKGSYLDAKITENAALKYKSFLPSKGASQAAAETTTADVNKTTDQFLRKTFSAKAINNNVGFASGGPVGTDTVPAMLTPGEFVFNKGAAQSIGYGNLGRMNKSGIEGFASGGLVGFQAFAEGGKPTSRSMKEEIKVGGLGELTSQIGNTARQLKQVEDELKESQAEFEALNKTIDSYDKNIDKLNAGAVEGAKGSKALKEITNRRIVAGKKEAQAIEKVMNLEQKQAALLSQKTEQVSKAGAMKGVAQGAQSGALTSGKQSSFKEFDQSIKQSTKTTKEADVKTKKNMQGVFFAMIGFQTALGYLTPVIDENSTATEKATAKFITGVNTAVAGLFALSSVMNELGIEGKDVWKFASGGGIEGLGDKVTGGVSSAGASMNRKGMKRMNRKDTWKYDPTRGKAGKSFGKAQIWAGDKLAGVAGSAGKVTDQLTKLAGPVIAAAGAFSMVNGMIDSFMDLEGRKQKAIEAGNAQLAGELAVRQKGQKSFGMAATATVGLAAGIGFLVLGPLGALIGGLGAAALMLAVKFIPGMESVMVRMGEFFGGDSANIIKQEIKNKMAVAAAEKHLAENSKKAAAELNKIKAGKSTAEEGLATGGDLVRQRDEERANQQAALKTAEQKVSEKGAGLGERADRVDNLKKAALRPSLIPGAGAVAAVAGAVDNVGLMMQTSALKAAQEEEIALRKTNNEAAKKNIQEMTSGGAFKALGHEVMLSSDSMGDFKGNYDTFIAKLKEINPSLHNDLMATGSADVHKAFMNQNAELQKTINYLKALNFGLRGVNGALDASITGFDMVTSASEIGANQFTSSAATLKASLTAAGKNISEGQLDGALVDLENTLREFGAGDKQIEESTSIIRGVNKSQRTNVDAAMEKVRASKSRKPEDIQKILGDELLQGLEGPAKKRMQASIDKMGDFTGEEFEQLESGSTAPILKKIFDPLQKEIEGQIIGSMEKRAILEDKLSEALQKRRVQELEFIDAQKKAIDTQLEAAKLFESFGGAKLTSDQQLGARRAQANLSLGNAGVGGLKGGGAKDIRRALSDIGTKFNKQADALQFGTLGKARGAKVDGKPITAAFGGAEGADKNKQDELKKANEAIITFTKQRITLIQEELKIAQQKNKAEKDALDKLLGGDIEGFLEGQLASAAGAALRTGDSGLAGSFGAGALGAGFKTLEGQGLSGQTMERAAGMTLSSVGVADRRSAQVMAGTTAEEEAKKAEGRELSQIMGEGAQQGADLEKIDITTAEVTIESATINVDRIKQEQVDFLKNQNDPNKLFARGGSVYASRGMFVSRGTDTIPAMLTPGEFVVNRSAVNRGNNLAMLQAMNGGGGARGMSAGGSVSYYAAGGGAGGNRSGLAGMFGTISDAVGKSIIDPLKSMFDGDSNSLSKIFGDFSLSVKKLLDFNLSVKVDPTTVTVNFNGSSFLAGMKDDIRNELLEKVREEIKNAKFDESGNIVNRTSGLP
jgi:hypothetical protein